MDATPPRSLMVLVFLAIAACGRTDNEGAVPSSPSTPSADALIGRRWVLEGDAPVRSTIKPGFELQADGTLIGHTGVNRANGSYTLTGASGIHIPPLVTTRMAGSPAAMDREQVFLGALAQADGWRIRASKLELLGKGEVILTLAEEAKPTGP